MTILQLCEKEKFTREYIALAEKVHAITKRYNVPPTTKVKTVLTFTDTLRDDCNVVPIPVMPSAG